jgi:hypothetical protein
MSISVYAHERPNLLRRMAGWWRDVGRRSRTACDLSRCDPADVERLARDVGVSSGDLYTLAGKWPDRLDLLSQRTEELRLDVAEIAQIEPQVLRDLQRTCALCASKRRCRHDLVKRPYDPAWQDYCPNTMTLTALVAERDRAQATGQA